MAKFPTERGAQSPALNQLLETWGVKWSRACMVYMCVRVCVSGRVYRYLLQVKEFHVCSRRFVSQFASCKQLTLDA
jgi:hypothetical protein